MVNYVLVWVRPSVRMAAFFYAKAKKEPATFTGSGISNPKIKCYETLVWPAEESNLVGNQ